MPPRKRKAVQHGGGASKKLKPSFELRITRNMTADGPRQAVFETAELLENILLHLPAMNIFGVQRVSRQFRDIVATSTAIRQKLFLQSTGEERQTWAVQRSEPEDPWFWCFAPPDAHFVRSSNGDGTNGQQKWTPVKLNPLLHTSPWHLTIPESESGLRRTWGTIRDVVYLISNFNLHPRATSASWRKTILTDPPTTVADVHLSLQARKTRHPNGGMTFSVTSVGDEGLTLGCVIDAAMKHKGEAYTWRVRNIKDATLDDLLKRLRETDRKPVKCNQKHTNLHLPGIVIPSEEEWQYMKYSGP